MPSWHEDLPHTQHLRLLPTPRPETRWDKLWAFLIVFTVGTLLTVILLLLSVFVSAARGMV